MASSPSSRTTLYVAVVISLVVIWWFSRRGKRPLGRVLLFDFQHKYWTILNRPPCCPPGSAPALSTNYVERGAEVEAAGGVQVYVVGPSKPAEECGKSRRGVVVYHDIFGWHSGRLRELCDTLAERGFVVALPDCFQGRAGRVTTAAAGVLRVLSMASNILRARWGARLELELEGAVWPLLAERGAERVGVLGFCWGGWCVAKACSRPREAAGAGPGAAPAGATPAGAVVGSPPPLDVRCGVGLHASPGIVGWFHGEGSAAALFGAATSPMLFLQAGNDPSECKTGGAAARALAGTPVGAACAFEEFPDMAHGWTNRGDLADPPVARDVALALDRTCAFLAQHLGPP